ncbi:MAG TPA: serine/threonine-protein kinase, partial [Acidimicrobiales bacterium]
MTLGRDRVARALPNYDVGDEVGRGAWGVVIKGEHRRLGRKVAIKELPQAFAADPGVQRRFASEARLLASLDHPHIVPIFDYVEEEDLCLLVMELLPGGTVWDRVTTEGISAEAACTVVLATCSALHYAHGKGILHRDIKPENLLFSSSGALKVTDFGIAKMLGGVETFATRTGEVLGTPAYIAPEQALAKELTPATDVYAVGTLLYELLAGRLPFADDGNAIALLYRHVHEPPTPLLEVAPSVPKALADVTMKALATDPADRYASADEFGAAVAEGAAAGWGSDWLHRSGLNV